MKPHRTKSRAFSLMEMMFAIVVLTLGMVFVAAQFPLGVNNARQVSDATLYQIDLHNAEKMNELQMENALNTYQAVSLPVVPASILDSGPNVNIPLTVPPYWITMPPSSIFSAATNSTVHLLVKPNVLFTYPNHPNVRLILDDPENLERRFQSLPGSPWPRWPFWSHVENGLDGTLGAQVYQNFTQQGDTFSYIGDIAGLMAPPVLTGDQDVIEKMLDFLAEDSKDMDDYNPTVNQDKMDYLHPALFEVAIRQRKATSCALYRQVPGDTRSFQFYFFTMDHWNQDPDAPRLRYAKQLYNTGTGEITGEAMPVPYADRDDLLDGDRRLPVPWLIDLNGFYSLTGFQDDDWFLLDDDGYILALLRKGSFLIDADNGDLYKVKEFWTDNDGQKVRIDRFLESDLKMFWVVPPAIIQRNGTNAADFADQQPVRQVTQQIIRF